MPPVKNQPRLNAVGPLARKPISSRAPKFVSQTNNGESANATISGKRKANASPLKKEAKVARTALKNLTNATSNLTVNQDDTRKGTTNVAHIKNDTAQKLRHALELKKAAQSTAASNNRAINLETINENLSSKTGPLRPTKIVTRAASRLSKDGNKAAIALKTDKKTEVVQFGNFDGNSALKKDEKTKSMRRLSHEIEQIEIDESIYMSAHEDFSSSRLSTANTQRSSSSLSVTSNESIFTICNSTSSQCDITLSQEAVVPSGPPVVPEGVIEFDKENWDDPIQVSHYAMDIFNYLKSREAQFVIEPYIHRQPHLNSWMRTLLVDWMVEVQETFELNHETLYLAVKVVDIYLSKVVVQKEKLQLVGAAALFMSCKYDERTPPLIEDFLYICDGAYDQPEFIRMEMNVFKTIGFDLGIPLSYRFLRRYARCAKVAMPELTLARFILEFSLMNYETITLSDSKLAAATLFMSLRMSKMEGWNKTLEFYSGYKLADFAFIVPILNASLHLKPREANKTVRNKYAHKIFHEVSKIPLLTNEKLFENTDIDPQSL